MARPLKIFMRGKSITLLQEVLRRRGYAIQDQKGLFGTDTRDAVKSFQKQQGLKPTGLVDETLLKSLQDGQVSVASEAPVVKKPESAEEGQVSREEWDVLIQVLLKKGMLAEGELEAEMNRVVPKSL